VLIYEIFFIVVICDCHLAFGNIYICQPRLNWLNCCSTGKSSILSWLCLHLARIDSRAVCLCVIAKCCEDAELLRSVNFISSETADSDNGLQLVSLSLLNVRWTFALIVRVLFLLHWSCVGYMTLTLLVHWLICEYLLLILLPLLHYYQYEVEGPRPRGRPKRSWREVVQEDCQARKMNKVDAVDCCEWRKMIKDVRWSGWVWVGECFFWYRPTLVVPDQRPLNGCVCVCVCIILLPFIQLLLLFLCLSLSRTWRIFMMTCLRWILGSSSFYLPNNTTVCTFAQIRF